MIICFEGPSGIGKTTMCQLLSNDYQIVPEVNLLFERPMDSTPYWYHERQVERYNICQAAERSAILDGDIFQPIWYNWACNYPSEFLPKQATDEFYRSKIKTGELSFPHLYIIFSVEEKELWIRKENDKNRQRRNFIKHLKIITPLKQYYRFLQEKTDLQLAFIDYTNIEDTKQQVIAAITNYKPKKIDDLATFTQIEYWLDQYKAQ